MRTKNLSQWISENKIASFFGGVFLLSIPVYTLIYLGEFTNEHVQSRLCLIAAYSSAISAILVTKISNRTKIYCSGSNRLMLFAWAFGIFSAVEWIAHIVWNLKVTLQLIFIDIVLLSIGVYIFSRILSNYLYICELLSRFLLTRIHIKRISLMRFYILIFLLISHYFTGFSQNYIPKTLREGKLQTMKDKHNLMDGSATPKVTFPEIKFDYKINTVFLDTIFCSSMGDSLRYSYEYSESGEEVTEICEILIEKRWVNFFKYQILANENNKTQTLYNWNDIDWIPSNYSHIKKSYDGDKIIEEASYFVWSSEAWNITSKFIIEYLNGNNISQIVEYYDEMIPTYKLWQIFSYNEIGDIESSKKRYFNTQDWVNIDSTNWNYLTKEFHYKIWRNNAWQDSTRGFHYQNQLGIDTLVQFEAFEKGEWKTSSLFKYRFDDDLNMTSWEIYEWKNEEWLKRIAFDWTYNSNNLLVTESYRKGNFNEWINSYRKSYTYTNTDIINSEIVEYWEDNNWKPFSKFSSVLDDNQNLVEYESNYWNNEWMPYDQRVNLIDTYGNSFSYYASNLKFRYSDLLNNIDNLRNSSSGNPIIEIYLNQSSGKFHLNFSISESDHVKYEIVNMSGRVVETADMGFVSEGNHQTEIMTNSAMESGIYIIRIKCSKGFAQMKFMNLRN